MYSKNAIKVHVELSNICNAVCPQCLRNYINKDTGELSIKDTLNTHELTIEDYRQIFDNEFFRTFQLKRVNFCGNISDPIASRDLREIVEHHIINNPNTQNIGELFGMGYTYAILGSDLFVLWKWADKMQKIITDFRKN